MSTLLEAALDAEARGWSVVPCNPRSKHPSIKWKIAQTTRASAEQICQWWAEEPERNLALATGPVSGLTVLDFDPRNSPDGLTLKWLQPLMPPPTIITGGGGWHWYCHDAGVSTFNRLVDGLDIRGAGGIVVTAPSMHPNGRLYERLSDRLATVPDDVLHMIKARHEQQAGQLHKGLVEPLATALTLAEVLSLLHGVRPYRDGWTAQCPAHDDANPSLSIKEGPAGKVLLHDFAGCTFQAIMRELWSRHRDRQLAEAFRSERS